MPLSKRVISARAAGAIGAKKRRQLTQPDNSTKPADAEPAGNIAQPNPDILSGGAESDSDSSGYDSRIGERHGGFLYNRQSLFITRIS